MLKNKAKRISVALLLLFVMIFQQFTAVKAVVPSTVDYRVFLNGTKIYLYNKKDIDLKKGTEVFFTYTVENVISNCTQQGILLTADPTRRFPYTNGGFMKYQANEVSLLDSGYTYFIKITVASGGFRYDITRAKDDAFEQIILDRNEGENTDKPKCVGLWLAIGDVNATLKNVRCYDVNGNDLGIEKQCGSGSVDVIKQNLSLKKANDIDHKYEITVDDKYNVAVSNVKVPTTSTVYMQYKVESAAHLYNQMGISLSNSPEREYPHGKGIIKYLNFNEPVKPIDMLDAGAEYLLQIERGNNDYTVIVQKTKNGKKDVFMISKASGDYDKNYNSVSLWFGTGERRGTFKLTDFLIYDGNRNNLGVMTNVDSEITHIGALEDYSGCEAAYYCEKRDSFISLYGDKTIKLTDKNSTLNGTYTVSQNVLTANLSGKTQKYDYLFKKITDSEKNVYKRLFTYKVSFVTGSKTEIPVQVLSNKTGYTVSKPTDPQLDGCKFEGWCTADKKDFDFGKVVTNSVVLYAKWSGDDGTEFIAVNSDRADSGSTSILKYVLTASAGLVFIAGALTFILLLRKGIKNGNGKK